MPILAAVQMVSGPGVAENLAAAAELLGELAGSDALAVAATREALTAQLVTACDRFGVRIVAVRPRGRPSLPVALPPSRRCAISKPKSWGEGASPVMSVTRSI